MGDKTGIEWTDMTANFWWGCFKVSAGCSHCYAESLSARTGKNIWGPAKHSDRERKKAIWADLPKWDRQAKADGVRRRVFVQSMSDFFEDHPQVTPWREEAMLLLESLEALDVQLLTKRPENVPSMAPGWMTSWPKHIWMGTSVEDQANADKRIPHLLAIPAAIRFLSVEPLLGPIDLTDIALGNFRRLNALTGEVWAAWADEPGDERAKTGLTINWVIVGGESGPGARPMHPDWVRQIRDDCLAAGVPFFMKQFGEYLPVEQADLGQRMPRLLQAHGAWFQKVGKKEAGRVLDGQTWSQFPEVRQATGQEA